MANWIKAAISKLKAKAGKKRNESTQSSSASEITPPVPPQQISQPRIQASRPLPAKKAEAKVPLLIGFDFGTHSTKVVVRRRGERQGKVLQLDNPLPGYPPYAAPSLIRLSEGKLWFGAEAQNRVDGTLYRLLKLELIKTGRLSSSEQSHTDLLVTAYFAWVLRAVRTWVDKEYGLENAKLFLNVAAPMDHFEVEQIKKRYLFILGTAWEWTFGSQTHSVAQSVAIEDVKSWMEMERVLVPDSAIRPYDVLPETVAPIVSLSQDPRMDAGMYLLIDMGAGTTELSINFVSLPGGNQNVLCYFDKSIRLGAEQFRVDKNKKELMEILLKNVWQTWCCGYEKDASNHAARQRWKNLRILLLGGGTCRKDVFDAICTEDHAVATRFPGEAECDIIRHGPADVQFPGVDPSPEEISLASVANGLAFPRMQWPKFYEPAEVQPIGGAGVQTAPDPWYLER